MTFHPSGLRERPGSCPTRRPPSEKEKSGLRSFVSRCCRCFWFIFFLCRRGSRQRRGDTEAEDLMCVCQTICQIQLFFFSRSHTGPPSPRPPLPLLVQKAVIQSRDPSVEEITPTWIVWEQNSCFVLRLSHIVYTVICQEFLPNEITWLWSVPSLICAKNKVFKIRTYGSNSAANICLCCFYILWSTLMESTRWTNLSRIIVIK